MATTYKLRRAGQFTVQTTGPHHCGTTAVLTIKYALKVTCTAKSLDSRGFLFDQTNIDAWFQAQRTTALSCEAYAAHCARALYKLVRAENKGLDIACIELSLSPAPHAAEITFIWDASQPTATVATARPVQMRPSNPGLGLQVGLWS